MTDIVFANLMGKVSQFFGKNVHKDRIRLWWDACERIHDDAADYIYEKITSELDDVPTNLPRFMNQHFESWKRLEGSGTPFEDFIHDALPPEESVRRARDLINRLNEENKEGVVLNLRSPAQDPEDYRKH